jgi:hypothetical protein
MMRLPSRTSTIAALLVAALLLAVWLLPAFLTPPTAHAQATAARSRPHTARPASANVRYADQFLAAGVDIGAKINAADRSLGAAAGSIIVRPTAASLVETTPVSIGAHHTLVLLAPVRWTAFWTSGAAVVTGDGSSIVGNDSAAVQSLPVITSVKGRPWAVNFVISGTPGSGAALGSAGVNGFTLSHLWFERTGSFPTGSVGGTGNDVIFTGYGVRNISLDHNHVVGGGLLLTVGLTEIGSVFTDAAASHDIHVSDNFVDGAQNQNFTNAFHYRGTYNVFDSANAVQNVVYGHLWIGNYGSGDITGPHAAHDMVFSGGVVNHSTAAWWGSGGHNIVVSGAVANGCLDVCLDSEAGNNITFSNFVVGNASNGALAVFYNNQGVTFSDGVVYADGSAGTHMLEFSNFYFSHSTLDSVKVHNVYFNCMGTATGCFATTGGVTNEEFTGNTFYNTYFQTDNPISNLNFSDNTIWSDDALPPFGGAAANHAGIAVFIDHWGAKTATENGSTVTLPGMLRFERNTFISNLVEPEDKPAFQLQQQDSGPSTAWITGNRTTGLHPWARDAFIRSTVGGGHVMHVWDNEFANHNVTLGADAGSSSVFDYRDPTESQTYSYSQAGATQWFKLGTWRAGNSGELRMEITGTAGYVSGSNAQGAAIVVAHSGNATAAPNLTGVTATISGGALLSGIKFVDSTRSGLAANRSWDVYIEVPPFAPGSYRVDIGHTVGALSGETQPSVFIPTVAATPDPGPAGANISSGVIVQGFNGVRTVGACTLRIVDGIITSVTGC